MTPEEIKKYIEIARKSVEGIEDKSLKEKTYEIVLNNLLSKKSTNKSKELESEAKTEKKTTKKESSDPYQELSKKFGISKENIEDYFEIKENNIEILYPLNLSSNIEEHFIFTLLILTLKKIAFGEREIDSTQLRESAKVKGLRSLVNLSTNLKKYPKYIIHKRGKIGSTNTSYKLTTEGYNKGIEIITKIVNGDPIKEEKTKVKKTSNSSSSKRTSGLTKEIDKLFEEGFFDTFITVNTIKKELRKRGFFNKRQDIDSYIRKTLMKAKGLLLREKKNKVWHYVKRK